MRPIKFRALVEYTDEHGHTQKVWEYYTTLHEPPWADDALHNATVIVKDLQFTGLVDKNGKEIYEGDVMKLPTDTRVIEWRNGAYWVQSIAHKWNYPIHFEQSEVPDIQVIGNIYENHELLEAK